MLIRPFNFLIVILLMMAMGGGLGILMTSSNHPKAARDAPSISVDIRPAQEKVAQAAQEQRVPEQFVGVTFARQAADIGAQSEGRLEAVYVNLGDHLRPGDTIAKVDSYSIIQQLEMAESSLLSVQAEAHTAEVELREAEARHNRRVGLAEAGVISREELAAAKVQVDKAEATLDARRAHVAEQMARVKQIKGSLARTVIKASFEGTVAARYLDPGATVHSGTPIISLVRSNELWVRFAIPQTKLTTMTIGSSISFYIEGVAIVIPGVIEQVSPGVTALSQELVVEAKLKIPAASSGQIKPGGSGLVSFDTAPRR